MSAGAVEHQNPNGYLDSRCNICSSRIFFSLCVLLQPQHSMKIFLLLQIACKSTCIGFKCSLEFQIPLEVRRGLVRLSYSGLQQMRAWQDESNSWQE